jgi:hypothetical protein
MGARCMRWRCSMLTFLDDDDCDDSGLIYKCIERVQFDVL